MVTGATHYAAELPAFLSPTHAERLISIGGSASTDGADGNYVLSEEALAATEVLVSFGINDDWSFEAAVRDATGATVHAYDRSTRDRFLQRLSARRLQFYWRKLRSVLAYLRCVLLRGDAAKRASIRDNLRRTYFPRREFLDFFDGTRAVFHPEFIGRRAEGHTPVQETLAAHGARRVMLKMDIEGAEYDVHRELLALPENVHVFLAEYHGLHHHENLDMLREFTENTHLQLVHVHANNYAEPATSGGIPPVLELTFIHADYFVPSGTEPRYPITGLDVTNRPDTPDYALSFARAPGAGG